MARPPRLEFDNAWYLVTTMGNEDIFRTDDDRSAFLERLQHVTSRYGWHCHGYTLLANRYWIFIQTPIGNLSKGMRQLNGTYTQYFNHIHHHRGQIFQGRFKAYVVDENAYYNTTQGFLADAAVSHKLVDKRKNWPWSSYHALLHDQVPDCLDSKAVLARYGDKKSLDHFKSEVKANFNDELPKHARRQIFIGDNEFMASSLAKAEQHQAPTADESLLDKLQRKLPRDEAMAQAYLTGQYTLKQLASHFGVHYVTVSRAVKNFENRNGVA